VATPKYTIVQSSVFILDGNSKFEHRLELHGIVTAGSSQRVRNVGGVLFHDYSDATKALEILNTVFAKCQDPPSFSPMRVDGLPIWIPPQEGQ